MIRIIGKNNCSACMMAKTILTNKNVDFTYELFENLTQEEQNSLITEATKQSKLSMPLIINDGNLYTLQEILKEG